jgi:hypothetical protein
MTYAITGQRFVRKDRADGGRTAAGRTVSVRLRGPDPRNRCDGDRWDADLAAGDSSASRDWSD